MLVTVYTRREGKSIENKRKTFTSSEVKKRYNDKTYKRYHLTLRLDTDSELIAKLDEIIASGKSQSDAVKELIQKSNL